ncbi:MAG: redox-regulated ATPase YchF [Dehalococcoidia bacterium]|nr:redox-regulated ATPase YchF [Dehalococcoidia bacterium]
MEIGIIGLSKSGKTTVFNALTRGHAKVTAGAGGGKPNVGVAKVPDARLDKLTAMFKPKKTTPAEVTYVDIPAAPEGLGKEAGIGGEYLNRLQRADALLHVVRGFDDPSVPHVQGTVDAFRDVGTMDMELAFSDLAILERRLKRLEADLKRAKVIERDALHKEEALLTRVKDALGAGKALRDMLLEAEERRVLENYQFLTGKPLLVALNIDEAHVPKEAELAKELGKHITGAAVRGVALCGKLEAELGQMAPEEEREFRASLGAGESGLVRMIRLSYDVLGLISFFTVGEDECRAWTITRGLAAQKAAGKIHSDIERGFIRAEVIAYDDLMKAGGMAEARKLGTLRAEGKTYEIKDGDIAHFLFNV